MQYGCPARFADSLMPRTHLLFQTLCLSCLFCSSHKASTCCSAPQSQFKVEPKRFLLHLQDWPTGEGLLPSITFRHIAGDAMDKAVLDKAEVKNADAIIMGVAHDADPKDVSNTI